jgi:serine/threonine-protein kinase
MMAVRTEAVAEVKRVGTYEIIAPIGTGGVGTVYKAIDREKDETIAVKVLFRGYDISKKRRKRDFLGREVLVTSGLEHRNILKIFPEISHAADAQGFLRRCLLMEYVDGHNLRKHIHDRDLTWEEAVDLCLQICMGLDYLHQNNVLHRDVKPENFLISRDGLVKIADFGLARRQHSRLFGERWAGGGTRKYTPPEELRNKRPDARSDIFSFGVTMYELFTGRHPAPGPRPQDVVRQLASRTFQFDRPSNVERRLPRDLDHIVMKAIRRRLSSRYQSVTELILDLRRLREKRALI